MSNKIIGLCPECAPKYDDKTEKELFECPYCKRLLCSVHLPARLAFITTLDAAPEVMRTEWWRALQLELQKNNQNSHPCWQYSNQFWNDFENLKQKSYFSNNSSSRKYDDFYEEDLSVADNEKEVRSCPFCDSVIASESNFCPYCAHDLRTGLNPLLQTKKSIWQKIKSFFSS